MPSSSLRVGWPLSIGNIWDSIQLHGGAEVRQDTLLPCAYVTLRILRIADSPDEVHLYSIAKSILLIIECIIFKIQTEYCHKRDFLTY